MSPADDGWINCLASFVGLWCCWCGRDSTTAANAVTPEVWSVLSQQKFNSSTSYLRESVELPSTNPHAYLVLGCADNERASIFVIAPLTLNLKSLSISQQKRHEAQD